MMKKLLFIMLLLFTSVSYSQEQKTEWLKAGRESQRRYFLKNSRHRLCGIFEDISAMKVDPKTDLITPETISIKSCLMATGSLDGDSNEEYSVVDQKEDFLYIKDHPLDDKQPQSLYAVPLKMISSLWGLRFPEGELMVSVLDLCHQIYRWRSDDGQFDVSKEFNNIKDFPFSVQGKGESVRYHVFEYHLGCGT